MVRGPNRVRYVTLEHSRNLRDNTPMTFLGKWLASGGHANMGPGPDPSLSAFRDVVLGLID